MPPPPPRKPEPPVPPAKAAPPRKPEAFIGNDSSTMMSEETFAEFEARMKSEGESGGTNTNPAIEERDEGAGLAGVDEPDGDLEV